MDPNGEDGVFAVEELVKSKKKNGKLFYLVKWQGWDSKHNTWEPAENMLDDRLVEAFNAREAQKTANRRTSTASRKSDVSTPTTTPAKKRKADDSPSTPASSRAKRLSARVTRGSSVTSPQEKKKKKEDVKNEKEEEKVVKKEEKKEEVKVEKKKNEECKEGDDTSKEERSETIPVENGGNEEVKKDTEYPKEEEPKEAQEAPESMDTIEHHANQGGSDQGIENTEAEEEEVVEEKDEEGNSFRLEDYFIESDNDLYDVVLGYPKKRDEEKNEMTFVVLRENDVPPEGARLEKLYMKKETGELGHDVPEDWSKSAEFLMRCRRVVRQIDCNGESVHVIQYIP